MGLGWLLTDRPTNENANEHDTTQEEALFDEMKEIQAAVRPDNVVFVMDATQGQAAYDQVRD